MVYSSFINKGLSCKHFYSISSSKYGVHAQDAFFSPIKFQKVCICSDMLLVAKQGFSGMLHLQSVAFNTEMSNDDT